MTKKINIFDGVYITIYPNGHIELSPLPEKINITEPVVCNFDNGSITINPDRTVKLYEWK